VSRFSQQTVRTVVASRPVTPTQERQIRELRPGRRRRRLGVAAIYAGFKLIVSTIAAVITAFR